MNKADFVSEVRLLNWNDILPCNNNVNEVFDSIINKVTEIVDKFAPIRKLIQKQTKSLAKPWVTAGIRTLYSDKKIDYTKSILSPKMLVYLQNTNFIVIRLVIF